MVSYKELGLVNTREMFAKAIKGGYAIPAFNFNNMEQLQAIISACVEAKPGRPDHPADRRGAHRLQRGSATGFTGTGPGRAGG